MRHCLARAADIRRDCVVNGITAATWAARHDFDVEQVRAARAVVVAAGRAPSPEACAALAMLDYGLDDSDIAEMFGRSERWATTVRGQRLEILEEEGIKPSFEQWMMDGDPTPEEINRMKWRSCARKSPASEPRTNLSEPG